MRTLFEDYVRKIAPKTVELKVTRMHGGKPWMTSFDNPFVQAAGRAIESGFGKTPVFTREGGSIPVVSTFQEELGLPSVLFGVGLPDENAHAPNEKLDLGNFHGGIIASAYPLRGNRIDWRGCLRPFNPKDTQDTKGRILASVCLVTVRSSDLTSASRLQALVSQLQKFYGPLPSPPRDPFTLFVWEVLSVHSTPRKRDAAFAALKRIPRADAGRDVARAAEAAPRRASRSPGRTPNSGCRRCARASISSAARRICRRSFADRCRPRCAR